MLPMTIIRIVELKYNSVPFALTAVSGIIFNSMGMHAPNISSAWYIYWMIMHPRKVSSTSFYYSTFHARSNSSMFSLKYLLVASTTNAPWKRQGRLLSMTEREATSSMRMTYKIRYLGSSKWIFRRSLRGPTWRQTHGKQHLLEAEYMDDWEWCCIVPLRTASDAWTFELLRLDYYWWTSTT